MPYRTAVSSIVGSNSGIEASSGGAGVVRHAPPRYTEFFELPLLLNDITMLCTELCILTVDIEYEACINICGVPVL